MSCGIKSWCVTHSCGHMSCGFKSCGNNSVCGSNSVSCVTHMW
ncbi:hypothetical protein Hamer_G025257 [Homarus americanus]|uniref:Uncharacterized protein n=1 Tax=Homarus americanus TaxID=6706 RepID=A0A8J5MX39_HOMAM|nr:hypothetical protein Hamer_G025257 [Homarus americanus]